MEKGYGGPVWCLSISPHSTSRKIRGDTARTVGVLALNGRGDPLLGQWVTRMKNTPGGWIIRRRLSAEEAMGVPPVADIRGTPEARRLMDMCGVVAEGDFLPGTAPPPVNMPSVGRAFFAPD